MCKAVVASLLPPTFLAWGATPQAVCWNELWAWQRLSSSEAWAGPSPWSCVQTQAWAFVFRYEKNSSFTLFFTLLFLHIEWDDLVIMILSSCLGYGPNYHLWWSEICIEVLKCWCCTWVHSKQPCKPDQYSLLCYWFGVFSTLSQETQGALAHQIGALLLRLVKELFSIPY